MQKLVIDGPTKLSGLIQVAGAKNSALPILAATILCGESVYIRKMPHLKDITTMLSLLSNMGMEFSVDHQLNVRVLNPTLKVFSAPYDLVKTMRASILVLGPMLARYGQARVSLPGGCAIGTRPIDQHLKLLKQMGATISVEDGYVIASADKLQGANLTFDKETVTGTENIIMAACFAEGKTVIRNAAKEPEVEDLADFINAMGGKVTGAGTSCIEIIGVDALGGGSYNVIPDRIEAGTLLIAGVMMEGDIKLVDCRADHLTAVIELLRESGATIDIDGDSIHLKMVGRPKSVSLTTDVYPGVPTDLQAQFIALNCIAEGRARVEETIFENRFMHVPELIRMGASIQLSKNVAIIDGVPDLVGAQVMATDLRASAALILAGLRARGQSVLDRIYHIDRGYSNIEEKFSKLGATIQRQPSNTYAD